MNTTAITTNSELSPQVRCGKPVVEGTRTTGAAVLKEMLANGTSAADVAD